MDTRKQRALRVAVLGAMLALSACATNDGRRGPAGILSDYERLQPVPGQDSLACWNTPVGEWKDYDKVMIEPVGVALVSDAKPVDPVDLRDLTAYFHESLRKAMQARTAIADEPGPRVVALKVAVTELVPTDVAQNIVVTAIPYSFVGEVAIGTATGQPPGTSFYLGRTAIEAQLRDAASGAPMAECAGRELGSKLGGDLTKGLPADAPERLVNGYIDSFSTWGYAKRSFDRWALFFADRVASLTAGRI